METVIAVENQAAGWQCSVSHSTACGIHETPLLPHVCCFEELLKAFPSCGWVVGETQERRLLAGKGAAEFSVKFKGAGL